MNTKEITALLKEAAESFPSIQGKPNNNDITCIGIIFSSSCSISPTMKQWGDTTSSEWSKMRPSTCPNMVRHSQWRCASQLVVPTSRQVPPVSHSSKPKILTNPALLTRRSTWQQSAAPLCSSKPSCRTRGTSTWGMLSRSTPSSPLQSLWHTSQLHAVGCMRSTFPIYPC